MDSLKTLFQKKEYELIISLTNKSSDAPALYYRLESFFHLEQFEKALSLIKNQQNDFQQYTFQMMKIHLICLMKLNLYEEAYQVVKQYENFPYISQEVEEYLNSANQTIRTYETKNRPKPTLSNEELENILLEAKDENILILALETIRQRNVSLFFQPLRKIVKNELINNFIRTFSLMLLIENNDDKLISFHKNNHDYSLVPKNINLLDYNLLQDDLFDEIESLTKNITIREVARQLFDQLFFLFFPDRVAKVDEIIYLKASLIVLASEYLKAEINVDELADKLQLDEEKLQSFINKYRRFLINSFE